MASLHELRARACPQPENPRILMSPKADPNAHFGWKEVRALQSPPPEIPHVGPRDVTPNRILAQMRGEQVFPEKPKETYKPQTDIEYKRLKAEREQRRKQAKAARRLQHR